MATPLTSQITAAPTASESVTGMRWVSSRPDLDVTLEGVAEARGVALRGVGAEVVGGADEDLLDEVPVLRVERLVETQVVLDRGDGLGIGILAHVLRGELVDRLPGQPGDEEENREGDCADDQQQQHRAEDASNDVRSHSCPAAVSAGRALRGAPGPADTETFTCLSNFRGYGGRPPNESARRTGPAVTWRSPSAGSRTCRGMPA